MTGWTRWAIALAVAALVASAATPTFAASAATSSAATQWLTPDETAARREALLKEMIARPNDLDLAFEYASLSSQAGDYEGAISTLERMLIYAAATTTPAPIRRGQDRRRERAALAILLWHSAGRPLPRSALHQGALLQRSARRYCQGRPEGSAGAGHHASPHPAAGGAARASPSPAADTGTTADRCRSEPQVVSLA
jgi:hypothetical protein